MRESNRMLPFREGNHTCPQRHKYSEMVGTHHPVGARGIVAGRFWAVRGGETTSRYGCEHATAYGRMAPLSFSSSKLVLVAYMRQRRPDQHVSLHVPAQVLLASWLGRKTASPGCTAVAPQRGRQSQAAKMHGAIARTRAGQMVAYDPSSIHHDYNMVDGRLPNSQTIYRLEEIYICIC